MTFLRQNLSAGYTMVIDNAAHILFLVATVLMPLFYLPYTRDVISLPKQFFLYGVVLAGLLLWLFKIVLSKELYIRRTILDIPLVVFLFFSFVSVIFSTSPSLSFFGRIEDYVSHFGAFFSYALWYWLFVQLVDRSDVWRWFIYTLLVSGLIASLMFLFRNSLLFESVFSVVGTNTVSNINSVFGIFISLISVLGIGLTMVRGRNIVSRIFPAMVSFVGIITLIRIGFTIPWVTFAVGVAFILALGFNMIAETSKVALGVAFVSFVFALIVIFVGLPIAWKAGLPLEVALGVHTSMDIALSTIFDSASSFFVGSGPGTFIYQFSRFRPDVFNLNQIAASIRFTQPYSSLLGLFTEYGILGFLSFVFVVIFAIGSMFNGWLKTRPSILHRSISKLRGGGNEIQSDHPIRLEVFVVISVWIAATVGLGLVYYDVVPWWLWWWLLAASVTGLSALTPDIIKGKRFLLQVSPQYSLALSFAMILAVIGVVMTFAFGGRIYAAEVLYTKAVKSSNLETSEIYIKKALNYRPGYIPYRIAAAQHYLQRARVQSQDDPNNPQAVAEFLSFAVNEARFAADNQPNDVQTWETLAAMYINARTFVADANKWAGDALRHIVELEPSNASAYWQLGDSYLFANNFEDAEDAYKQAIFLKSDFIAAYVSLSQLYEVQENLDDAISTYEPIINFVQDNPEVLYNLGRLFFNRYDDGDIERAKSVWLRSAEIAPNYSNVLYSLGLLYEKTGENNKALGFYQRVMDLNPDNADVVDKIRRLNR